MFRLQIKGVTHYVAENEKPTNNDRQTYNVKNSYYISLEKAPMALEEEKSSYIDRAR